MNKITGSEINFLMEWSEETILDIAQKIWDNPENYSPYPKGSSESYYDFIRFLWVELPSGKEKRLADVVIT